MFVHILPKGGNPSDFEVDIDSSLSSRHVGHAVQEIIFEETGIQPEQQSAHFCPASRGIENVTKHSATHDPGHPASAEVTAPKREYPEIFEQSIVYVTKEDDWTDWDCSRPENRVQLELVRPSRRTIEPLYGVLNGSRAVQSSLLEKFPEFRKSVEGSKELRNFLKVVPSTSPSSGITPAELKCYDDIFHKITKGVGSFRRRRFDSNQMHTWFFASMMLQHPFFLDSHPSLQGVEMTAERATGLRMFAKADDRTEIRKVTPQSNLAVIDNSSSLPILVCEVDFPTSPRRRPIMYLQGLVACRQWRYILPEPLKDKNMFLGLFVRDDFVVEVDLFHADNDYRVRVFRDKFLLIRKHEALRLAMILFNFRDSFSEIAGQLDRERLDMLVKVISSEKLPRSVTSTSSVRSSAENSSEWEETCTDPLLLSAEVRSLLCPDDTFLQGTTHENVAAVRMLAPPFNTVGFVKLVNRRELKAFDVIRKSESKLLLDHIILPTKVVELSGNSIAFLPHGGDPFAYSWGRQLGHETEVAWNLLNIVACLHQNGIAHMDIKPTNVLWDSLAQSIRVIDFDSSVIVGAGQSRKTKGQLGTPGFIAPEVASKKNIEYDPFLADAFSCGKVVFNVVTAWNMTDEALFVQDLSKRLTVEDVDKRWSINKVMEAWTDWLRERERPIRARE